MAYNTKYGNSYINIQIIIFKKMYNKYDKRSFPDNYTYMTIFQSIMKY